MVELMTHQNSVGNALQEGNHLIMDGKVNDEEEGEIREQMTLLNSRWESLRLSAMERQSLWVDATAICINGTMDIAWIYICGTLNVTWICICGTADMTWFCIVGQWVWHECAKWWNINMTWACLFIIYFLGSLVLHSWLLLFFFFFVHLNKCLFKSGSLDLEYLKSVNHNFTNGCNPFKTSPPYTLSEVYGKCVL